MGVLAQYRQMWQKWRFIAQHFVPKRRSLLVPSSVYIGDRFLLGHRTVKKQLDGVSEGDRLSRRQRMCGLDGEKSGNVV